LDSWKEIASYLKRDVRTVQRWEKAAGLPVHRLRIGKSGGVYALKSELDSWWKERRPILEPSAGAESPPRSYRPWLALLAVIIAFSIGGFLLFRGRIAKANKTPLLTSLAVLPLANLTGDESQEYFSDGMTDAVITELAQLPGLRVISRTSTIHYKGTKKTLPEIARELQVDAIVEGTVTRGKDDVKITAQLIYARSDTHLWAGSFTGSPADIIRLQGKVADEIATKIEERLTSAERATLPKPATTNAEAYEDYLKGSYFFNKGTEADLKTAIHYLREATNKDPNFAEAYSRLSFCYLFLSALGETSSSEARNSAREAAEKAIALDDSLEDPHVALATAAWHYEWDWTHAQAEFKRAIQLNPNTSVGHLGYSQLLLLLGKSDLSMEEERAATQLDPISVASVLTAITNSYYRRQYDQGLLKARTAIELYPLVPTIHVFLSNIFAVQGQDRLAAQEILTAEELSGASPERMRALKAANDAAGLLGLRRKRIELNKNLAGQQLLNAYDIAIDCAAVGDTDQALLWLGKASQVRDHKMALIGVEPIFDPLRSNPRFVALLRQVGLNSAHT
jgi:TolB-like protein